MTLKCHRIRADGIARVLRCLPAEADLLTAANG
jgi:hypothetical protein